MENDDYILRDNAINALTVSALLRNLDSVENGTAHRYRRAAERIIAGVPAADVELVRHGQWIAKKKNLTEGAAYMIPLTIRYFVCSLCGREEDNAEPYCNCGAKMDREPQEEADGGE